MAACTVPEEFRTALPGEAPSASEARRFVTGRLANAVLHAHTDLVVVVRINRDRVTVEVHDGSAASPNQT